MFAKLKKTKFRFLLRHALLLLILFILQSEVLPWLGRSAMPSLLAVAAAGVAHKEGPVTGAVFGLFAGMLTDSAMGRPLLTFTLLLPAAGLALGILAETWLSRSLPAYLACCGACTLLCGAVGMFSPLFFYGASLWSLLLTLLLQLITSLIAALILYPILQRLPGTERRR